MTAPPRWLQVDASKLAQLIVIEPLFEEANRCRRLVAQILRALDAKGVATAILQLPGTGESEIGISEVRLEDWRAALADASPLLIASFRGGTIIDDAGSARSVWRFAPETGARIVRDLKRASLTSGETELYAGHRLGGAFLDELATAKPAVLEAVRTVRLASDAGDADLKVAGSPLWRRAEPGEDPALAAVLADDLLAWVKTCAVS